MIDRSVTLVVVAIVVIVPVAVRPSAPLWTAERV
jgi:hypothetical protein